MAEKKTYEQGYQDAIQAIKQALANQGGGGQEYDPDFPDIDRKLNPPPVPGAGSGQQNNSKKKNPTIGDHGNPDKQKEEQQKREAEGNFDPKNPEKDQQKPGDKGQGQTQPNDGKGDGTSGQAGQGTDANDADYADKPSDAGKKANDPTLNDRIKQIKDILAHPEKLGQQIQQENTAAIQKEKAAKAAKDAEKYRNSPLTKFRASMDMFVKNEIATNRGPTWRRPNRKYADSGLMRPGTSNSVQEYIPSINVYFDRSGSWNDEKTKVGEQAVATLNRYVQQGEIKIKLFYFAWNVHENKSAAEAEGGTAGQPILNHIAATKPDNVVIMTDADISDCKTMCTVPGAVWLLFKGGTSQNLIDHIKGKKQTRRFEI